MHSFLFQTGSTPLYIAAREGHVDTVKLLVESGADLNAQDEVCVYLSVLLTLGDCKCVMHENYISTDLCNNLHGSNNNN